MTKKKAPTRGDDWYPRTDAESRPTRRADGDDIEQALDAAERLLAEGYDELRHLQNMRLAAVSLLAFTLLSVGGLALGFVAYDAAALLGVMLVIGAPATIVSLRIALRPTRPDSLERAAEIAAMIGEVVTDVAQREDWSTLRMETTRLRLSAFPLFIRHDGHVRALAEVEPLFDDKRGGTG